jgi:hypothetical protein
LTELNTNQPEHETGNTAEHRSTEEVVVDQSGFRLSVCEIATRNWAFDQDIDEYLDAGLDRIGAWWAKAKSFTGKCCGTVARGAMILSRCNGRPTSAVRGQPSKRTVHSARSP